MKSRFLSRSKSHISPFKHPLGRTGPPPAVNLALLGPSGSGKGTHVSTLGEITAGATMGAGDLLRSHLRNQTALGQRARNYMEASEMVPDDLVEAMMEDWIQSQEMGKSLVFDGFPRTVYQARFLDRILRERGGLLDAAIYFQIPDEVLIERLSGRLNCLECGRVYHQRSNPPRRKGKCDQCRKPLTKREDDTPELIAKRLHVFHREIGPVLSYYHRTGRLKSIPADQSILEVGGSVAKIAHTVSYLAEFRPPPKVLEHLDVSVGQAPRADSQRFPQLDLVLLGGPGSGKGTQAEQLCKQLQLPHIATGDLFRENLRQETELGKLAKTYMDRGELVPDEVTESMVQERLSRDDTKRGFVLDGFPRSLAQAESLTEMLDGLHRRISAVIRIEVSDEAIIGRLSGRLICRECQAPFHLQFKPPQIPGKCDHCQGELYQRDDDNPETVSSRLKVFHAQTEPLIDYYQAADLVLSVEGEAAPDAVHRDVMEAVGPLTA